MGSDLGGRHVLFMTDGGRGRAWQASTFGWGIMGWMWDGKARHRYRYAGRSRES